MLWGAEPAVAKRRLKSAVQEALQAVSDPCSLQTSTPMSIVDMGLVREVDIGDGGDVKIKLAVTSPGCTLFPSFARAASERICAIPGVASVEVEVDPAILWSPADMLLKARLSREQRHQEAIAHRTVRPRQWAEPTHGVGP
jgi:metal-sulfur cluster biosynthetic enzyme